MSIHSQMSFEPPRTRPAAQKRFERGCGGGEATFSLYSYDEHAPSTAEPERPRTARPFADDDDDTDRHPRLSTKALNESRNVSSEMFSVLGGAEEALDRFEAAAAAAGPAPEVVPMGVAREEHAARRSSVARAERVPGGTEAVDIGIGGVGVSGAREERDPRFRDKDLANEATQRKQSLYNTSAETYIFGTETEAPEEKPYRMSEAKENNLAGHMNALNVAAGNAAAAAAAADAAEFDLDATVLGRKARTDLKAKEAAGCGDFISSDVSPSDRLPTGQRMGGVRRPPGGGSSITFG